MKVLLVRIILTILSFVSSLALLYWVLSEKAVIYEMAETGMLSRAELNGDLGIGLLIVTVVVPSACIGATITAAIVWFISGKIAANNSLQARRP